MPPPGQAVASKCPFLAAEMGQKNSSVVRQVGMEFQEDVQEVRTVQKGKSCLEIDQTQLFYAHHFVHDWILILFCPLLTYCRSASCPVEEAILGHYR